VLVFIEANDPKLVIPCRYDPEGHHSFDAHNPATAWPSFRKTLLETQKRLGDVA
jgi:hypothetical protein